MDNIIIEFDVQRTLATPSLNFRTVLDGAVVHALSADLEHVKFEISDDENSHELIFELLDKLPTHTKVDQNNNVVEDAVIEIKNITIDGINIDQIVIDSSKYNHNYNGHGDAVTERFYGTMGCNGTVSLKFATPVYLWLLENM